MAVIGWVTLDEANTYLAVRPNALGWFEAVDREGLLAFAYDTLITKPDYAHLETATVTDQMKSAQIEQAWFLYTFITDIDRRMALVAQGVRRTEVFKEYYRKDEPPQFPIAPLAQQYLSMLGRRSAMRIPRMSRSPLG